MTPDFACPESDAVLQRLRKNRRHFGRWARRTRVDCYRVYDSDVPAYAAAIDVYGDHLHVQEFEPPRGVDPERADARARDLVLAVHEAFEAPPERVHVKVRRRQRGAAQYERLAATDAFLTVREEPCTFLVNLDDYLDTGLFLDHRITRARLRERAAGRRFLNLFCYTATATAHAAAGGARSTTSVDLSRTYLEWAAQNLAANGCAGARHRLVRADVTTWLEEQPPGSYDLVFVDPPTFSNSKRMRRSFDVQRDHVELLRLAARLLAPGGEIVFSTNARRFELRLDELPGLAAADWTRATIPPDFARNPRVHRCWRIAPA